MKGISKYWDSVATFAPLALKIIKNLEKEEQ